MVLTEIPVLETERTLLRGWSEADLDPYAAMYADPEVMRHLGGVQERPQAWRAMASFLGHWQLRGYGLWVVQRRSDGTFLGRVGLWNPEGWPGVEIGWALARENWGQGYATECAQRVLGWAWASMPELGRILSVIAPDNVLSQRVAGRLGMTPVGTHRLGETDTVLYGVDRPSRRSWEA